AAALFYSMRSNRDRNEGIAALVRSVTGNRYATFWRSVEKHMNKINNIRNRLAHGLVILDIEGKSPRHLVTKPVAYWIEEGSECPYLTKDDILAFSQKTAAVTELIKHFSQYLRGQQPEDFNTKWEAVFSAAVDYPFPVGHPLAE